MKAILIFLFLLLLFAISVAFIRFQYHSACYKKRLKKILLNNEYVHVKPSEMMLLRKSGVDMYLYTRDLHYREEGYGPVYCFRKGFSNAPSYLRTEVFLNWSLSEALEFKSLLEEEKRKEQEQKYESNESKEAYEYLIGKLTAYAHQEESAANGKMEEAKSIYEKAKNINSHSFH